MRTIFPCCSVLLSLWLLSLSPLPAFANENQAILNENDSQVNYGFGFRMANELKQQKIDLNPQAMLAGVRDALDKKAQLSEAEIDQELITLGQLIVEAEKEQLDSRQIYSRRNQQFLHRNLQQQGISSTDSGLQFLVIKPGQGEPPSIDDTVTVHYKGSLISGRVFDSSYRWGQPVTLQLSEAIAGWSEGLQMMKPGAHWRLFIPADLGYGENGFGKEIPGDSTLIFDVELLEVN